jgi:hypothetical protein
MKTRTDYFSLIYHASHQPIQKVEENNAYAELTNEARDIKVNQPVEFAVTEVVDKVLSNILLKSTWKLRMILKVLNQLQKHHKRWFLQS